MIEIRRWLKIIKMRRIDLEKIVKIKNSVKEEHDKDEKIKDIKIMINIRKGEESLIMIKMRMIKTAKMLKIRK